MRFGDDNRDTHTQINPTLPADKVQESGQRSRVVEGEHEGPGIVTIE